MSLISTSMVSPGTMSPSAPGCPSRARRPGGGSCTGSAPESRSPYPRSGRLKKILPDRAVMADNDAEPGGVQASDNPGPKRFEGVAVLTAKHGPIGLLPIPLTDIVPNTVAKNIIQGVFLRDIPRLFAYDYR